jgi:hypothetical protein
MGSRNQTRWLPRVIARRYGAGVRLLTRNGRDFSERYPAVAAAVDCLRAAPASSTARWWFWTTKGRAVSEQLQRGPRTNPDAIMLAFDLLELNGQDLKREPLLTRKATLLSLLKGAPYGILYNEHMAGDGPQIFKHACKLGCRASSQARRCPLPIRPNPSLDQDEGAGGDCRAEGPVGKLEPALDARPGNLLCRRGANRWRARTLHGRYTGRGDASRRWLGR